MNCKYCGSALPTNTGHCPSCGKMIPIDQLKMIKEMIDPKYNQYRNKDTHLYKKESAYEDNTNLGKVIVIIILVVLAIIILAIVKGV